MTCRFFICDIARGSRTWHGDPKHLTVAFFDYYGVRVTTKHITRKGYALDGRKH